MIRVGSESLSWLVFVNSCHASSKNCPGPPFDVAIPSTTISANTATIALRPRHTSCVLCSLHRARSSRRSIPHAAISSPSRLPAMTRHRMIPSGVRSSSGMLIPFSAGRVNASDSTGISATIVAPSTASPRSRCPPSSVMTKTAAISATRPPREYVIPRHVVSTNSALIPAHRTTGLRVTSVAIRKAIGTASTHTSPSAFQYCSGSRRREANAVWSKLTPRTFAPGMSLPPSAYSAHSTATTSQPVATRSIARGALHPTAIASTATSPYAMPRLTCIHVLSGATDHSSVTPHHAAKPNSRPTPIHASVDARNVSVRENSQPLAAPIETSATAICRRGSSGSPTPPWAKTAYAHEATRATRSAVPGFGLRLRAWTPTRVATRALAGVVTAMGKGRRC